MTRHGHRVGYTVYPVPLLGPAPCIGCGEPLYWAKRQSRRMGVHAWRLGWREEDGTLHYCPNLPRRIALARTRVRTRWDNGTAEYSGPIAHNAQRPSVRLYSEREGVGYSGVQTE